VISQAQNLANVRSAERLIAIQQGIDSPGGDWRAGLTYDQRVAFDKALADYIIAHPAAFSDATVATARIVAGHKLTPLEDSSFDWEAFSSAVVDNGITLGDRVADVGRGVAATASLAKWVLPVAALVAVALILLGLRRKVGA
jgi:hypothetical protein